MAKRVKERYDARQYVAAAFGGLVLEACCLLLFLFFYFLGQVRSFDTWLKVWVLDDETSLDP